MPQYVYFFGGGKADGSKDMKDLLGGKGAGLAEMTNAGLPVPPGFTLSTAACNLFVERGGTLPAEIDAEIAAALVRLEALMGKTLGAAEDPLLVSVRSGAKFSMPGMMDTILNLGLNDRSVEGLRVNPTPVAEVSPMFPKTMLWTFTAVPRSCGMSLSLR